MQGRKKAPVVTATRQDVQRLAKPLWLLINGCNWSMPPDQFEHLKCAVLGLVAQLAYCSPTEEEKEHPHRARLVPCALYQRLMVQQTIDLTAVLAEVDFQNVAVVSTRRYTALIVPAREMLLVGVRGTQFAYDWLINLTAIKSRVQLADGLARIHSGFFSEAKELASRLAQHLSARRATRLRESLTSIYLAGHSLGGAVASILNFISWAPSSFSIDGCYVYGAPRIAGKSSQRTFQQPFATRRPLDIVPCVPPKLAGYSDFSHQRRTDGAQLDVGDRSDFLSFTQWIVARAFRRFIRNHSMDRYCHEILMTASQHPRVKPYWNYNDVTESLRDLELFE